VARCCATRWLSDAICCCSSDGDTGRELAGSEGVWSDGVSTGDRSDGARCVEHIVEQDETPAEQSAEALRLEEAPADDSLDFFESDSFEREPLPPESDPACGTTGSKQGRGGHSFGRAAAGGESSACGSEAEAELFE